MTCDASIAISWISPPPSLSSLFFIAPATSEIYTLSLHDALPIFSKFTYFLLLGLGVLLGVNAAGVDVTTLNVLTGAIGLGLGFGLQSVASNFVSGFVLLVDKSIKPGDVISFTGTAGANTEIGRAHV